MRQFLAIAVCFCPFAVQAVEPDLSNPVATVKSYVQATKANDLKAAKSCWTIDDDNESGALDIVAGMAIASRKLAAATNNKIGAEGTKLLGKWNRPIYSDKALELTLSRLTSTIVKERGDIARLTIMWEPGDSEESPAFLFLKTPLILRKVGEEWKLDGNAIAGSEKAADLFGPNKIWPIWRDEMQIMNEITLRIEKDSINDAALLDQEIKERVATLKTKYQK